MKPRSLGIGWQIGVPSGWGVYGVNLALELARSGIVPELFFATPQVALTPEQAGVLEPHLVRQRENLARFRGGGGALEMPLLHALGDKLDLPPFLKNLRGSPDIGLAFIESAVIPTRNLEDAKRFAVIVAGSTWNAELLRRHGIGEVRTCLQGVDLSLFSPGPRAGRFAGRFAIFSGGKLEYRKGQDLVVAAFKRFHGRHPDALLVAAWHNPWPEAARGLSMSTHLAHAPRVDGSGRLDVAGWLVANGLPESAFVDLGALNNAETPEILREVDVGLFPNRCEGGTNLVAMEAMACGVPAILSRNTGHLDLMSGDNCFALDLQIPIGAMTNRPDLDGWGESSIEQIVSRLEDAYTSRERRLAIGAAGAQFMTAWGWPAQVQRLVTAVSEFTAA
ncbi:MAG: glycosyltransferase family 4 protein [Rhodospirillaceae bacterium]|nr:glycosyltransferase family 4 protein [Rhodospirillaceae bacterium]